ncbi:MAG TPA: adenosylhomocysteinase, partial [Sediminispirochaeta sp.]|nr:adenosylhomocysteinase [Sediminispirochaeta sp.]
MQAHIIRDASLAPEGRRKINWVRMHMPVLRRIEEDFRRQQYFKGLRVAVSVHLEAKTAYLAEVMAAGGAEVAVTGSNPKSTKDDVVAALSDAGLHVYAWYNANREEFRQHQLAALDIRPHIVIDDGGDLVHHLHGEKSDYLPEVLGACEETTAGVLRNQARQKAGELRFPVLAVNNAYCKYLFDNRYGTGQSTMDALMRSTNKAITGATVVVSGYGWCGKGIALRAAGMGARVVVTEVDEIKALEAAHEGFWVMPMAEAARIGDFFVTTTGTKKVLTAEHFSVMKDGAVLANAGHFYEEIDTQALDSMAVEKKELRQDVTGYLLQNGRWINVVADGKIVNISAADGHPAEIMDMSFALQALSARYVAQHHQNLEPE